MVIKTVIQRGKKGTYIAVEHKPEKVKHGGNKGEEGRSIGICLVRPWFYFIL